MTHNNQQDTSGSDAELTLGYEEMAADVEREKEAVEWIESHVGECS